MISKRKLVLIWVANIVVALWNVLFSYYNLFIHPAWLVTIGVNAFCVGMSTFGLALCIRLTRIYREHLRIQHELAALRALFGDRLI